MRETRPSLTRRIHFPTGSEREVNVPNSSVFDISSSRGIKQLKKQKNHLYIDFSIDLTWFKVRKSANFVFSKRLPSVYISFTC